MGCMNKPKPVAGITSVIVPPTKMPVVIVGTGNNRYGYSNDLVTWTWGSFSFAPTSICCGIVNSASLWVVIGNIGTTFYSSTSTNGTTWTTPSSNISAIFTSTGWIYNALNFGYDKDGNGIFLATGRGGPSGASSVAISNDGLNWVTGGFPFATTFFGNNCYYGNGYWVVVGNSGNTSTSVMYSSNISIAGNASIIWTSAGTFTNPAYGVVYTGNRWLIGSNNNWLYYSSTNVPNSTYSSNQFVPQYPNAIMSTQNSAVAGGAGIGYSYLSYFNPVTTSSPTSALSATSTPSRTWQIEYVASTATWIAVMEGTTSGNNSIAYSTDTQRQNNTAWTNIATVNTNMKSCVGIAAAR